MKEKQKKSFWFRHPYISILSIILITIFIFFCFILWPFIRINMWPRIDNAEILVKDCKTLILQKSLGKLEFNPRKSYFSEGLIEEYWPDSIKKLKPRAVYIEEGYVSILISTGGIDPSWGYLVLPENSKKLEKLNHIRIYDTKNENIYKWEGIE